MGDASKLTYGADIRLCDIGSKTQETVVNNDWCGDNYIEAAEFKGSRLLRRRVLNDNAAKPALMQMDAKDSSYCDATKNA